MIKSDDLAAAHPYVDAILAMAKQENALDAWLEYLATLSAVASDKNFVNLVTNPQITKAQVLATLCDCLGTTTNQPETEQLVNLLTLLQENQRLVLLPAIFVLFNQQVLLLRKAATATIYSAYTLADAAKKHLEQTLSSQFSKTITATVVIDEALIGGIKIEMDDLIIDASIKNRLTSLATMLAN